MSPLLQPRTGADLAVLPKGKVFHKTVLYIP